MESALVSKTQFVRAAAMVMLVTTKSREPARVTASDRAGRDAVLARVIVKPSCAKFG